MIKLFEEFVNEANTVDNFEDVVAMINDLNDKGLAVVTTEKGAGKNSKYVIRYKRGLVYWVDFINKYEYLWGYDAPDGTSVSVNSTSELDRTDWEQALNPARNISFMINNIRKHIGQFKAEYTRAQNAYNRSNKSSDYEKSFRAKDKLQYWEKRSAKYEQLLKYV